MMSEVYRREYLIQLLEEETKQNEIENENIKEKDE